jgi:putrescine transport system permease protein
MSRAAILLLPWMWLGAFLIAPLTIVLAIAFASPADGVPPIGLPATGANFGVVLGDPFYLGALLRSLKVAAVSAIACIVIGYPMAFAIARAAPRMRAPLLLLVMVPFWTGFLLRITAWIGLLQDDGWVNTALLSLGLIGRPLHLLYTDFAMYAGITYTYLPFMVLPVYARLARSDVALEEAAADLGAPPWRVFLRVTWPLSLPGVFAGLLLVFIPAVGEYVVPELLGGPGAETAGRVLWNSFFQERDWPTSAALAVAMFVLLLAPAAIWQWRQGR